RAPPAKARPPRTNAGDARTPPCPVPNRSGPSGPSLPPQRPVAAGPPWGRARRPRRTSAPERAPPRLRLRLLLRRLGRVDHHGLPRTLVGRCDGPVVGGASARSIVLGGSCRLGLRG